MNFAAGMEMLRSEFALGMVKFPSMYEKCVVCKLFESSFTLIFEGKGESVSVSTTFVASVLP